MARGPFAVNPALNKSNLFGSKWRWHWEPNDTFTIVQRVTTKGTFSVSACGEGNEAPTAGFTVANYEVDWEEEYLEAWVIGSKKTDENHTVRPAKPAQYLAEQGGFTFSDNGKRLFLAGANLRREVFSWRLSMTGMFEVINGYYPDWTARAGFYTSKNDFRITRLVVDGKDTTPVDSRTFDHQLYPGWRRPEVPGFPPPITKGLQLTCDEKWNLSWESRHFPTTNYTAPQYTPNAR